MPSYVPLMVLLIFSRFISKSINIPNMKNILIALLISSSTILLGQSPVTPGASEEAVELLKYIYSISGKQTLSGQHCAPLVGSTRLAVAHRNNGQYPAVFGQDFGFTYPGYWDGINYRQRIVDEAIRRYEEGFIITIMWHAVPPNQDEPVSFRESIQSDLTEQEWKDLVTPGTLMNERWKSQVDVIAWFLKQLDYADVPVLWRPYHEMNGGWFWWGQKKGDDGYKKLWQMMFDRMVNFHGLKNLSGYTTPMNLRMESTRMKPTTPVMNMWTSWPPMYIQKDLTR